MTDLSSTVEVVPNVPLRLIIHEMREGAKIPALGLWDWAYPVVHAHCISENGNTISRVLPPRTTRSFPTGIGFTVPRPYHVTLLSMYNLDPILVIPNPHWEDGELHVALYNGGHDTVYIKHESPLACLRFESTILVEIE